MQVAFQSLRSIVVDRRTEEVTGTWVLFIDQGILKRRNWAAILSRQSGSNERLRVGIGELANPQRHPEIL